MLVVLGNSYLETIFLSLTGCPFLIMMWTGQNGWAWLLLCGGHCSCAFAGVTVLTADKSCCASRHPRNGSLGSLYHQRSCRGYLNHPPRTPCLGALSQFMAIHHISSKIASCFAMAWKDRPKLSSLPSAIKAIKVMQGYLCCRHVSSIYIT